MNRTHHNLIIWQEAINFVKEIYEVTARFPQHELYGITSQMRRCAVSVPSNIAEGAGRLSRREYMRFLAIARGSLCELETQVIIAQRLGYISDICGLSGKMDRLFGLLGGLINSMKVKCAK
ncbi:MAG: four helix bundle protein [Gammaproteobacteria bacterium]|nr:four helix bundle protein [Gammaproteobacteria bacterium]